MRTTRGDGPLTHDGDVWFPVFSAVIRRPHLWSSALRQFGRTVGPRWWRRPPFLPVPSAAYLRYRMETAYGARGTPTAADVVAYLEWCRRTDRALGDRRRAGTARH